MYDKSASYYDAIYSWKNYKRESDLLKRFIRRYKRSPGKKLLDVACGTGNHISFLKKQFLVEGLDVEPSMLRQARRKNPDVKFYQGDMSNFQLRTRYDVVTCLFSAIGHVKTVARLRKAVSHMADHVLPGGLLILEPWFMPGQWTKGWLSGLFVNKPDLKLARISVSERNGRCSINNQHHLIGTRRGVAHFVERVESGLFTDREYRDAITKTGLIVRHDSKGLMGRGLYFGLKPTD